MKVCVEVLEKLLWFQDEKTLRVGATDLSKKESFVARNGGFCIFAAVQSTDGSTVSAERNSEIVIRVRDFERCSIFGL